MSVVSKNPVKIQPAARTKNIVATLINAPEAAVHQVKNLKSHQPHGHVYRLTAGEGAYLNVGLKLGALPILRRKQAKLVTQNVMRYVIVTKLAMELMSMKRVN